MKRRINLRELQLEELRILCVFDELCKEHNINYYLAYGTLLGAVRHKGFIPWDDDIDVMLPRPEYRKLQKIVSEGKLPQGYSYGDIDKKEYIYPFMKIYNENSYVKEDKLEDGSNESPIWIDVFPMDGLPSSKFKIKLIFFIHKAIRMFSYTAIVNSKKVDGLERVATILLKPLAKLIGSNNISRFRSYLATRFNYEKSTYIGNVLTGVGPSNAIEKEIYLPKKLLEFEDRTFPAPLNYERHLTDLYGNYMKLPPEENRKSHLNEECFLLS